LPDCDAFAGTETVIEPDPVPVSVLENSNWAGFKLCNVIVEALVVDPLTVIAVCTCRSLPIVRVGGVRPLGVMVKPTLVPVAGVANPDG
jgi:hypothetical protein